MMLSLLISLLPLVASTEDDFHLEHKFSLPASVHKITYSGDGGMVSVGHDEGVKILDSGDWSTVSNLGGGRKVTHSAWTKDGSQFIHSGADGTILIYETEGWQVTDIIDVSGLLNTTAHDRTFFFELSPDETTLVVCLGSNDDDSGWIFFYSWTHLHTSPTYYSMKHDISSISWSPNSDSFVADYKGNWFTGYSPWLVMWTRALDHREGHFHWYYELKQVDKTWEAPKHARIQKWANTGAYILSGMHNENPPFVTLGNLYSSDAPKELILPGIETRVQAIALSNDDRYIAVGSADGHVSLARIDMWNSSSLSHIQTIEFSARIGDNAVAWSPDAKYIVAGDKEGHVQVWRNLGVAGQGSDSSESDDASIEDPIEEEDKNIVDGSDSSENNRDDDIDVTGETLNNKSENKTGKFLNRPEGKVDREVTEPKDKNKFLILVALAISICITAVMCFMICRCKAASVRRRRDSVDLEYLAMLSGNPIGQRVIVV